MLVNLIVIVVCARNVLCTRGPHHPRSAKVNLVEDRHFHHEKQHIQEDLGQWSKKLTDMNEDEKNFYYFKLHDLDNNNNLDGLEMLTAATHHDHKEIRKLTEDQDTHENDLTHIIGVIDDFFEYADLDDNGYLNYPEYIRAINNTNKSAVA